MSGMFDRLGQKGDGAGGVAMLRPVQVPSFGPSELIEDEAPIADAPLTAVVEPMQQDQPQPAPPTHSSETILSRETETHHVVQPPARPMRSDRSDLPDPKATASAPPPSLAEPPKAPSRFTAPPPIIEQGPRHGGDRHDDAGPDRPDTPTAKASSEPLTKPVVNAPEHTSTQMQAPVRAPDIAPPSAPVSQAPPVVAKLSSVTPVSVKIGQISVAAPPSPSAPPPPQSVAAPAAPPSSRPGQALTSYLGWRR